MSKKHNLKIEVLNPTDIESEVPSPQILRSPHPDDGKPQNLLNTADPMDSQEVSEVTLKQGNTVENYSPVITVKTVESNFGKDGLRFQRLTVTEDVSVNFQHLFKKETKSGKTVVTQYAREEKQLEHSMFFFPSQPSMEDLTPLNGMRDLLKPVFVGASGRPEERFWSPQEPDAQEDKSLEEKKAKTRIPISRFKSAVTKVERERKQSEEAKEQKSKKEAPEKPPRRSSIPKLSDKILVARKSAFKSDANDQERVKNNAEEPAKSTIENKDTNVKKPVKTDRIPILRRNLNRTKDNPSKNNDYKLASVNSNGSQNTRKLKEEKPVVKHENYQLEDEFDKLYEEIADTGAESIPIEILDTKVKDPEKLDIKFEEIVHQYDDETIEQVKLEPMDKAKYHKIPLLRRRYEQEVKLSKQHEILSSNVSKPAKRDDEEFKNDNDNTENESINKFDDSDDFIQENIQRDLSIEINNNNPTDAYLAQSLSPIQIPANNIMATPDAELVKVGLSNFGNIKRNFDNPILTSEKETVKMSVLDLPIPKRDKYSEINDDIRPFEEKNHEYTVEEPISINDTQYIEGAYMVDKPEVAEIEDNEDDREQKKDNVIRQEIIHLENSAVIIPNRNPEPISGQVLNTNGVEEINKSRYDIKSNYDRSNKVIQEDLPAARGSVDEIMKRLTSQESTNNDRIENKNSHLDLNVKDKPLKGNVSKLLNRIASHETDENTKKELHDLPKKKSVLSKIAMFEQVTPEPVVPKKPTYKYAKPQRTISEEIRHSPKIVHEVLKPSIREEAETPYKVVNIDILQPIEIITPNEEQVLVVENLKEETITYENLEQANAVEPDDYEPYSLMFTADNELIVANDRDDDEVDNSEVFTKNSEGNRRVQKDLRNKDEFHYIPVKEKIHRLKSHEGAYNMRKAKSTAELDLGDAVKGKVKHIIVRMNSLDLLDDHAEQQREVINVKERPRKKSVSEKIALFEKKLVTVAMATDLETARAISVNEKPVQGLNSLPAEAVDLDEEYDAKILELRQAKATYGSVANMTYMELRDGGKMPVLALGTALLDPRLAKHIVMAAIDLGFRAIDTAYIYGTEAAVGQGIRAKIEDGTVRREDLFITSKLWSTFHAPELVEGACRASLEALGLEYFDLFMIHNPMSMKEGDDPLPKIAGVLQYSRHDYMDAWFAMEPLLARGLARRLGLSNFNSAQVARVADKGRVKPVVNQVECHPYLTQQPLADFCEARGVALSCYGVLGSKGTPAALRGAREAAIDDPLVQVMAAGLGISPAQLLIQYQLKCGRSVVVKASTAAHLWADLGALSVPLLDQHVTALHALNKNRRTFTFKGMGHTHKNYPFNLLF